MRRVRLHSNLFYNYIFLLYYNSCFIERFFLTKKIAFRNKSLQIYAGQRSLKRFARGVFRILAYTWRRRIILVIQSRSRCLSVEKGSQDPTRIFGIELPRPSTSNGPHRTCQALKIFL